MTATRRLGAMTATETYHLVCRNCEHEQIVSSAAAVRQQATDHEAITDHRVVFKQVV